MTTTGQVWRLSANGVATLIAAGPGVALEGLAIIPDAPVRYGPLAGKIIAGPEGQGLLCSFAASSWPCKASRVAIAADGAAEIGTWRSC